VPDEADEGFASVALERGVGVVDDAGALVFLDAGRLPERAIGTRARSSFEKNLPKRG
jgi:hypothetical protein